MNISDCAIVKLCLKRGMGGDTERDPDLGMDEMTYDLGNNQPMRSEDLTLKDSELAKIHCASKLPQDRRKFVSIYYCMREGVLR